ncbi:MAG TPA: YegS/Rv2252/BmrU family lipid kinase, partial [Candidatus Baltobacteraceae bacterium]|nr:YegS/Rv2252/BmrU family lipid kinase [Candidatus Baltobacteraceae bacterium]
LRSLLVLNQNSRRGEREGDRVCRTLEELGIECVRDPGAASIDAIIAAGGDGTIVRTMPLVVQRQVPLAIVPLGTFNDLARTLGVPMDVEEACRSIATGNTRTIDVGRVNGRYFVNEASVGVSTRIARRQTSQVKQRFGALAVIATTFQSLRAMRPFWVELGIPERPAERFRTIQLTVANSARFGGIIERRDASLDDGWLDLYSIEPENWLDAFRLAGKILRRDATSGEGLRTRRAVRFDVRTAREHHVSADGEPAGKTPATFEIVPKAVRVIVPKAHAWSTETSDTRA